MDRKTKKRYRRADKRTRLMMKVCDWVVRGKMDDHLDVIDVQIHKRKVILREQNDPAFAAHMEKLRNNGKRQKKAGYA